MVALYIQSKDKSKLKACPSLWIKFLYKVFLFYSFPYFLRNQSDFYPQTQTALVVILNIKAAFIVCEVEINPFL